MIVAGTLMILGLLAGILLVQYTGLRMGGVVVIPLLGIYTLYSAETLPLFIISVIIAVYAVGKIKANTLLHGRPLFLASLGIGMFVPLLGMVAIGMYSQSTGAVFLGTVLPGIAAYNYHQLEPAERIRDVKAGAGVLLGLLIAGFILLLSPMEFLAGSRAFLSWISVNPSTILIGTAEAGPPLVEVPPVEPGPAEGMPAEIDKDDFDTHEEWVAAVVAAAVGGEFPGGGDGE